MFRGFSKTIGTLAAMLSLAGCNLHAPVVLFDKSELAHYKHMATKIDYPDVNSPPPPSVVETLSPMSLGVDSPVEYWDLPLTEVIRTALINSKVLNDLGGLVLQSPTNVKTVQNPAITETDPRFGVDATLSAFDAQFSTKAFFAKNHRAINNIFFGGGTRILQQDTAVFQTELSKRSATGATMALRHNTDRDANNAPGNLFPAAWNTNYEAEVRQPLLQGAGVEFNRIYGPPNVSGVFSGVPGFANGVLVARLNTDISLTDFEAGVRDLVSNIENAYWDLYFAYRELDAKIAARDSALETWRRVQALYQSGRRGGEAEKEAEAREQYFRFQEDVQIAWYGRLVDGTHTFNGSGGGTLRSTGGVRVVERRLRMLMGLPITDTKLIRPSDEPRRAKVIYEWDAMLRESLARRVELRRQKWVIKRRELELLGARNFLLPTLDATALYRFRGFGQNLIDFNNNINVDRYDNAVQNLFSGQFQEWQAGFEFSAPLGFRRGHAAVRNAELQLAREKTILCEQERQVAHAVSNAMAEIERAYQCSLTAYNRRIASREHLAAVTAAFEADKAPSELVLDSQRRLAEGEIRYFGALVEYALAIKNVHFEKGSLLDYNEVYLSEGPWPNKAHADAAERDALRGPPRELNYVFARGPLVVASGTYAQGLPSVEPQKIETEKARPTGMSPWGEAIGEPAPSHNPWAVPKTISDSQTSTGASQTLGGFQSAPMTTQMPGTGELPEPADASQD